MGRRPQKLIKSNPERSGLKLRKLRKQQRLAPNLPDKLKLEKERKKLENERDAAWREYDGAAKEIEQSKDR